MAAIRRCRGSRMLLLLALLLADLPALASSLAAWRINRQGQLELRTAPNVQLRAFYEAGSGGRGPRVWIDLPGAPGRSRTIRGSGSIQEVRIGRPDAGTTRLVLEFLPSANGEQGGPAVPQAGHLGPHPLGMARV
ncbi:MAG: AMIN domain-containing protein, partial [Cyanobium sp.]